LIRSRHFDCAEGKSGFYFLIAPLVLPSSHFPGEQTGADRAALNWALSRGIECGGFCPKGRKAEDGRIAAKYPLIETPSANYVQRTEWNVRDTGGTVILSIEHELTSGSRKTAEFAVKHNKPCLHIHLGQENAAQALRDFVADNGIATLNVAGPRANKEPQVGKFVKEVMEEAFPV
jgi:hypothetical protein